jgi:predicted Zn-dependent protease
MPPSRTAPAIEEMVERLERALADSPADETDIVWLDARRGHESLGKRRTDGSAAQERTLLVRVRQSGRTGLHRGGSAEPSDLAKAVREALAQARLAPPSPPPLLPPGAADPLPPSPEATGLADPELVRMTPARAKEILQRLAARGEQAQLGWEEGFLVVANSRGLRRAAELTCAWLAVSCAPSPGAGSAEAMSRSLDRLDAPAVFARARSRHASEAGETAEPPQGPVPAVLSAEAAGHLIDLLNRQALTSTSFPGGALRNQLGAPVFHAGFSLRDDATDPRGVPLAFDLLGSACRPIDLVDRGVLLTPAVEDRLAVQIGRPPTPHLVAPDEARASHLFVVPGGPETAVADTELLGRADGGLWIGALEALEGYDPASLRFRAVARGVRRIADGALGAPLPDLLWEDDLQSLLARLLGMGREAVSIPSGDPLFGATTAPGLAFEGVQGLRPAPTPRS